MAIHPTAVVDVQAEIHPDAEIGPYAVVEGKVTIGTGTRLYDHTCVSGWTTIGENCRIYPFAAVGHEPQDLAYDGSETYCRVGDNCRIREGVTIHRGTSEGTMTEIGDGCFLMGFSHYAHNVKLGQRVIVVNGSLLAGYVEVGDGVFISGNCGVHQFVKIGRLAMLGGGGGISKDVPPFCTTRTTGFNEVVGLNVVGMRRAGMTPEERKQVKAAYRILYRSGLNVTQAVEQIRASFDSGPALEFCDFVAGSERGLCGSG